MLSRFPKNNNALVSGNENGTFFKPKSQQEQSSSDSEYGEEVSDSGGKSADNKSAAYSTNPINFSEVPVTGESDNPLKEETSSVQEEQSTVPSVGNVQSAKQDETMSTDEEVSPEKQEHLQKEFEIYCQYKLEMIERGEDVIPSEQKKPQTKEEKRAEFLRMTARFYNRMEGNKRTFWGTERYERLLNKWFPDYSIVIAHKVSAVKNTMNSALAATNQSINEIIERLTQAISVADEDTAKAAQLLESTGQYVIKAIEGKEKTHAILAEYGKDQSQAYMARYDQVLGKYNSLISALAANIEGVGADKTRFSGIIGELSAQQSLLANFSAKVSATSNVQLLIGLQEIEFTKLIAQADGTVDRVRNAGRNTAAVDETATQEVLDSGDKEVGAAGIEVETIKQTEIKRREEEQRKLREAEAQRQKVEEARKKAEAERVKQQQVKQQPKASTQEKEPSIFVKDEYETKTVTTKGKTQFDTDPNNRKGTDYTKKTWSPEGVAKAAVAPIGDPKFSATDTAFFAQYKKDCDDYLNKYYEGKNATHKLTGDMFVNAAKRIYIKYKHLSYIPPVELAMAQALIESSVNMKGKTFNNPYNVGEKDKKPASWVKEITSPEIGVYFYMDLLAHDYLSKSTPTELVNNYVNEKGSRYASSPHYEMELKANLGIVGLVRDGKQITLKVGRGYEKNNGSKDAAFVRDMLAQLGYKQADLGSAIEAFQKQKMFPPLTAKQQEAVVKMAQGDRDSFNAKEKKGVDGAVHPKGYTVGVLYFMTGMKNKVNSQAGQTTTVTVKTTDKGADVNKYYKQYKNGNYGIVELAKNLKPYCKYFGTQVMAVFADLGWTYADNLAFPLASHATDAELKHFDKTLLERMKTILDPSNNYAATAEKKVQWERIKKALGGTTVSASNTTSTTTTSNTTSTKTTQQGPTAKQAVNPVKSTHKNVSFDLKDSVGSGGKNYARDVLKVQNFLISFNYLSSNSPEVKSVQQAFAQNADAVISESQLSETISAIKQYQKYGATTKATLKKQDGKISKNGYTHQSIIEMNQLNSNYKDEEFAGDIPNVLTKAQWRSQFRFGANFSDGQDAADKDYSDFIKKETGLSDPADLHTASKEKRDLVEHTYKGKKGKWFSEQILKTNGLKMNQKARPYKPNMVCCWDASQLMLGYTGATAKGENSKVQTFVAESGSGKFTNQAELGVKYIDAQLKMRKAVFVGVEKGQLRTINEGITDHFILIVGKHKDGDKWYYYYFDPGTALETTAYDEKKNRLYIGSDKKSVANEKGTYKLSQIRVNNE